MNKNEIIRDFFMSRLERDGECEAIYDYLSGTRYRYADLARRSRRLSNYLQDRFAVRKGDRVAICASNCVAYVDLFYAIIRTGMIMTSYNVKLMERELIGMMENEAPKVLFYDDGAAKTIADIREKLPQIAYISLGTVRREGDQGCYQEVLEYSDEEREFVPMEFEDIALLLHTGGTTGTPKGAMISYRALYYNVINQISSYGITGKDVGYLCLPLFHAAAWNSLLMPMLYAGGRIVMARRFEAEAAFSIMKEEHLTFLVGVPSIYHYMMEHPGFEKADFSGISRVRCGAAPATLDMMKAFWKKGVRFCNGYGMTETGPGVLSMPMSSMTVEDLEKKRLSVGKPMINVRLRIVDKSGNDVPRGEKGELLIHSAAMFSGYWNNPEETAHALRDGWMHSGDIAMQDEEGYYYIVGRRKNMFISHGENIYPAEIETIMKECRGIRDICVIGVKDKRRGEVGKAIVVPEKGSALTEEDIFEFIGKNLPKIKQPRYVELVNELPRNSVGKLLLSEIRQKYGNEG